MSKKDYSTDFYVYAHYRKDPEKFPDEPPYYIGKGRKKSRAYDAVAGRSTHHKRVIAKYGLHVKILHKDLTEESAFEAEVFYIKEIGRKVLNAGPLLNLAEGGQGPSGRKASEEERLKRSLLTSSYFADPSNRARASLVKKRLQGKKVRVKLDNGVEICYFSLSDASEELGCSKTNLGHKIAKQKTSRVTAKNYEKQRWVLEAWWVGSVNEGIPVYQDGKTGRYCIITLSDNNEFGFNSISKAAKELGVAVSNLNGMCRGKKHAKSLTCKSTTYANLKIIKAKYICHPSKS